MEKEEKNKWLMIDYGFSNVENFINLNEIYYVSMESEYKPDMIVDNRVKEKLRVYDAHFDYILTFHFKNGDTKTEKLSATGYEQFLEKLNLFKNKKGE